MYITYVYMYTHTHTHAHTRTQVPATKLLEEEQDKLPVPGDASQLLTERVRSAVQTIKRRKLLLKQYAQDIQGKTGLGGLAALAYCRRVVNRREPIWGDLLMIVMANQPKAVEVMKD